jgi:serine protease Do
MAPPHFFFIFLHIFFIFAFYVSGELENGKYVKTIGVTLCRDLNNNRWICYTIRKEIIMFSKRSWFLILFGIVIGIVLVIGLGYTKGIHAQENAYAVLPAEAVPAVASTADYSAAEALSNVFSDVAAKTNPSVVTIYTETNITVQGSPFAGSPFEQFFGNDDFFQRFFQQPNQDKGYKRMGLGSGVIVDADGIVLTNNHVIDDADNIKVRLMDEREFTATVKGKDAQTDLAVLKIDAKNLTPMLFGDSDNSRVGEIVLAIGSPLNPQLEHTVTSGIISAKGRSGVGLSEYEDYIQTDAAINPGNSGGALVDLKGRLIGINTAIVSQSGGFMGIGFAIPSNLANKVMHDIITGGKVVRGWLGVYIQNITPELAQALKLPSMKGVLVSKVQKNSPAEKAGLQEEDVILALNDKELKNVSELSTRIAATSPGSEISLKILREGKERPVSVKLEELPEKQELLTPGKNQYPDLGIEISDINTATSTQYHLNKQDKGVVITKITPGTIAAGVGLKEGDVIIKVNREEVTSVVDFEARISKIKDGEDILFYLRRGAANLFIAFTKPSR